jgi:hypothetical protein
MSIRTSIAVLLLLAVATPAAAQPFADASSSLAAYTVAETTPQRRCESFATFTGEGITSIEAHVVAATSEAPQHCRVAGVIAPEIAFEVNLPDRWNRRFYMIGNGGHAGEALDNPGRAAQRSAALAHGFVMAQTNTGHDARKEPGASFVMSNPQKAIDYAYRAVHVTAVTAKHLAREYYGTPVSFSYWNSCSNGGRQGLIEAQRYPDDFDGIVANAPWVDQTGFTIGAMWNQRALTEAPVPVTKLNMVAERVVAVCDGVDGLVDGLIDDPRACRFDPAVDVPACREGQDAADCLTAAEAATLTKIHGGVISQGKPFFPGFMYGSETAWPNMIVASNPDAKPADFNLAENTMRYLVFDPPRPDYDFMTFDFDRDTTLLERWGALANATSTDLAAFRDRGGKLIMTYGWADSILQPMMGVEYYERVMARYGATASDFARLFMMPGVAHCGGGYGPDRHDAVTAVIDWVEKGRAPDALRATQVTNGTVVRTRPLCPYPQVARYTGQGSIDEAANFRCVAP